MPGATIAAASPFRRRPPPITLCQTAGVALAAAPIERGWLLDGAEPRAETATLARNADDTLAVYLWQTTGARYRWIHRSDEVVTVLDGECFVRDDGVASGERRLGPGDVAFFPAGSRSRWRVPVHLRKVSTLVRPLPRPAARLLKLLRAARAAMRRRPS